MSDIKYSGTGTVTIPPPGTAVLSEDMEVSVVAITAENDGLTVSVVAPDGAILQAPAPSDHMMVTCAYPGGYTKSHQVKPDYSDLADKIAATAKGRFGLASVSVSPPSSVEIGSVFKVGN